MSFFRSLRISTVFGFIAALLLLMTSSAKAQTWNASAGAESKDEAVQADAFLPNEMTIYAGDTIIWTFAPKNEAHTVTFLTPNQVRPPFAGPPNVAGCPPPSSGVQPTGSSFTGASCVNSGPLAGGATYSVKFPTAGNYKMECLVHPDMTGVVHVLPLTATLPHNQGFYDDAAKAEKQALLNDNDPPANVNGNGASSSSSNSVIAGTGEIVATTGGRQYRAVVRFLSGTIHVHVGDTVVWSNLDPTEPHTVTFGTEPANPQTRVNVTTDPDDGALLGTINSTSDSVSSGFLAAAPQGRIGLPEPPPGTTVIRVTFTHAGTYNYICALHDVDGMIGTVIVK